MLQPSLVRSEDLPRIMRGEVGESMVSREARGAQASLDKEKIRRLVNQLRDAEHKKERRSAAIALGESGDPGIHHHLVATLDDPAWEVRCGAITALGTLGDPRAIGPLVERLQQDPDPDVRCAAASGLGRFEDVRVIEPLFGALQDLDHRVTVQAEQSLVHVLQQLDSITSLVALLSDRDPKARTRAAFLLGELGDRVAVEGLLNTLQDPDPDVRRQAAEALGKIRDPRAVDPLIGVYRDDSNLAVRLRAVGALGKIGDPRAIEPLARSLDSPGPALLRMWTAVALGKLGDARAAGLLRSLPQWQTYSDVKMKAAEALEHIRELQARREASPAYLSVEDLAKSLSSYMGRWGWKVRNKSFAGDKLELVLHNDRLLIGGTCLVWILTAASAVDNALLDYLDEARRTAGAWKAILVAHHRFSKALRHHAGERAIEVIQEDHLKDTLTDRPGTWNR